MLRDLLSFLRRLEEVHISYSLGHSRDDAVMVEIDVPGERWEVEFLEDGSVEVEKFVSGGSIGGREMLDELFARFSD